MNDLDQFVGQFVDAASFGHGFLLSNGVVTTIDFPGALLGGTEAAGINDSGQIAGTYSVEEGDELVSRGYLATPVPEPSALLLAALAGALILCPRRIFVVRS